VTYSITGNTDPRVGVTIDANNFIDINPEPGVETQSMVTVEALDGEGNRGEGTFLVDVQKPKAFLLLAPPTLVVFTNQDHEIEVVIEDQFEKPFTGEEVTLTITNTSESATFSPPTISTSAGRATFTYSPGATSGADTITIWRNFDLIATIEILIGEKAMFVPFVRAIPVPE
jgi:hypothetical protein